MELYKINVYFEVSFFLVDYSNLIEQQNIDALSIEYAMAEYH